MPLPDTKHEALRLVEALKAWADRHPFAAAALFRSPEEYMDDCDAAEGDQLNCWRCLSDSEIDDAVYLLVAEEAREKAVRPVPALSVAAE